ncbi:type II toxin-antitoxin system PemK/MazF family toxin [Fusobacterium pseudoperiodonticum]|uniref:type II toxin-antitoxin system PemK/MazF family toxin n=1 Tax=Fusobacterium pseudoperiodonticum TaxID=2663009 RepID=UPI001CEFAFB2|nr:type II toxin-antitoxin system PemK/MazF family toxin [Fusobacterium pseudoperiodonticum]
MIGKIYTSMTEFFDSKTNSTRIKARPVLILTDTRNNDYTVLPISTITIKTNIDTYYDIKIDPISYPKLKLKKISYVRTHKRTSIHQASIDRSNIIGDLKIDYEELFLEILKKVEEFDNEVIESALR